MGTEIIEPGGWTKILVVTGVTFILICLEAEALFGKDIGEHIYMMLLIGGFSFGITALIAGTLRYCGVI